MDRDKSALMLNHSGAESLHAAMRRWSSQRKVGLVESCVQDATRAAGQVGCLVNFSTRGRKGKGPSLFELRIRDATAVGNVESFFLKLNTVLTQASMLEFSGMEHLSDCVETVRMKRGKGIAQPGHVVEDSHRPDVVLVTRPKKRKFKGIANRDANLKSNLPEVVDLSSSDGSPDDGSPVQSDADLPHPTRPTTRSQPAPVPEIPTTQQTLRCEPTPEPILTRVQETDATTGRLFLARISPKGRSPVCRGQFKGRDRLACGRYIREAGLKQKGSTLGVVGICWMAAGSKFNVPGELSAYWFCPNNKCCEVSSIPFVTGVLPRLPSKMVVERKTNLSEEEILFLQANGLDVHFVHDVPNEVVSAGEQILDLNLFVDQVDPTRPDDRLVRCNGIRRRRRPDSSRDGLARIQSAMTEVMVCKTIRRISTGNATGLRLIVNNMSRGQTSIHCVQICVFPTCSCKDFMWRESIGKAYYPCKHLYWCFANICKRDIGTDQCVNQPILTLTEVHDLVSGVSIQ